MGARDDYYEDDGEDYDDDYEDTARKLNRTKARGAKRPQGSGGRKGSRVRGFNLVLIGALISALGSGIVYMGVSIGAICGILGNIFIIVGIFKIKSEGKAHNDYGVKPNANRSTKPQMKVRQAEPDRGRAKRPYKASVDLDEDDGEDSYEEPVVRRNVPTKPLKHAPSTKKFTPKFCPSCGQGREGNKGAECEACEFDIREQGKMDYHEFCMSCGESDCDCTVRKQG
jgi:hypothetical protein